MKSPPEVCTGALRDGVTARKLQYDASGRLVGITENGDTSSIETKTESGKTTVAVTRDGKKLRSIQYDEGLEPIFEEFENGNTIQWQTTPDGSRSAVLKTHHDGDHVLTRKEDGSGASWKLADGGEYKIAYDARERRYQLFEGERRVGDARIGRAGEIEEWTVDGETGRIERGEDGRVVGLLLGMVHGGDGVAEWLHIEYDALGQPVRISDYSGASIDLRADATASSGLEIHNEYDSSGKLRNSTHSVNTVRSSQEYTDSHLIRIRQFDGGETRIQRDQSGLPLRIETSEGLALE